MQRVYLITEGQLQAVRLAIAVVATFIELHTSDDISNPDLAYARARAIAILASLEERWQHLPTARTIGQG